jgi:two-component system, OmpR family, sensor histidine kinase CreC
VTRLLVVGSASIGLMLFVAFVVARWLRSRTHGMSVRMQVFFALALIVGAFSAGLGVLVVDRVEARGMRLATQAAEDEATALTGILAADIARSSGDLAPVVTRLEQELRMGADLKFELFDTRGARVFPPPDMSIAADSAVVTVQAPLAVEGKTVGTVRVVKPTVVVERMLADFAPTVLVISLVLGAAAALAAALIGRAIAQPIEKLTTFAEQVSSGERSPAVPATSGGREVDRLARALDSMRRQLEGRPFVETFAADLSHELKNPVAAVRASAEVLEEGAIDEPERARHFVSRIRQAAGRIEDLLHDLVSLAHIEARGAETLERVDFPELVRHQLTVIGESSARVQLDSSDGLRVHGDAAWLARAVNNLVVNALRHSPTDSPVSVSLTKDGLSISLSVQNEGEVIGRVRDQLFRRFVTTRTKTGGSGLGLAIVRAVAEAHGGRVELADAGPPLVRFRLTLPAA